jgi:small subunit ribosomal protein S1
MTDMDSKTSETPTTEVAPVESQPPVATQAEAAPPVEAKPVEATLAPVSESASDNGTAGESAPALEAASADADTLAGEVAAGEAQADTVTGDAAPDEGVETSSGGVQAEGDGKKKRRRRRKKKGAQVGASDAPPEAKSTHHHAPFLHLFSGGTTRKHAFSVGEEIAGRVERVERGAIIVDLFGKATAIVDVDEPRDLPSVVHAVEEAKVDVAPEGEGSGESFAPETSPPIHTPLVPSPVTIPTPVIVAPTPEMAKLMQSDASAWEFSPTEVTDVPDEELGEADTVVGAQAFDPGSTIEAQLAATEPPSLGADAVPAAGEAAAADVAANTEGDPQTPAEALDGSEGESAPPEEPAEADLTLLDPLPELEPPQVGAIFRGRIGAVAESGHIAIVNRLVDKGGVRRALRAARDVHQRVQGVVYGYNRGGFDVLVGGVRAFCPASAMSLTHIDDPNTLVGQRCEFSLPQDKGGKKSSIIVSRRSILEKEARKKARERMTELEVGTKLKGKVIEVRDYGVLVDIGDGLDGLVHMSEVSWSRGVRPQQVASTGDEVDVEVLKVQPASRKDRFGRVSLSMRACQPDPWDVAKDTIRPGTPIKGKVVRTTDFGAFIELQENIEGLLHISELGGSRELTHAKQAVTEGDEINVVVERVDREQRRISLSKLTEADAAAIEAGEIEVGKAPRSMKQGSLVPVVVKRVDHTGVQVQVEGMLGKRGRGFIPSRELQDVRDDKRKGVSQGDVIQVKVIGTERDGTLRCSIRARLLDDERKAVKEYRKESAKQGLGTFGDLLKAKLGGSD